MLMEQAVLTKWKSLAAGETQKGVLSGSGVMSQVLGYNKVSQIMNFVFKTRNFVFKKREIV